jgi:hypothetical protein
MEKILQFETDAQLGMDNLEHKLRLALKITPSRMDRMVALDNKARAKWRNDTGHKKPGPKPKAKRLHI